MSTAASLLDAVDGVIAEHGPSGVTLRRVGTAASLSHTAAAHYFGDKPGLMTAYVTRAYRRVADRLDVAATKPDPREALIKAAVAYARFAQDEPAAFSVMSRLELTHVDTEAMWHQRRRAFNTLVELVARYQSQGWASSRETLDLVATCWSFVHGFVNLWVGGPLAAPYEHDDMLARLQSLLPPLLEGLDAQCASAAAR